jgi:deoxycytidine triphosphate deaminase
MPRKDPFEERPGSYDERADFMARRIASRTSGAPAAVLSGDALVMLQEDEDLRPLWREELNGDLICMTSSELKNPENQRLPPMQASLNLHVGNEMLVIEGNKEPQHVKWDSPTCERLPPMSHAIVKSRELICMPPFLVALLVSPVRTAISGVSNISTMIDPNFEGFLLLNLVNHSPWDLNISPGAIVGRAVFHMVAHVDVLHGTTYSATHEGLRRLEEIIDRRLKEMESTVYSSILREKLRKWIDTKRSSSM